MGGRGLGQGWARRQGFKFKDTHAQIHVLPVMSVTEMTEIIFKQRSKQLRSKH